MPTLTNETKAWYPSKKLDIVVGILLAAVVENTSTPFIRNPGGFLGGFVVQLLLVFCFPLGIANLASGKGKNPAVYGWVLLLSIVCFAMLAYVIAHQ